MPQRYQVFFDDLELVKAARPHLWNEHNCPATTREWERQRELAKIGGPADPILSVLFDDTCFIELEQRIQFIKSEPESEKEKHWPGICRGVDEQVYIPALYRRGGERGDPSYLYQRGVHAVFFNWHVGELRLWLTTECAEHVPYEPYPDPPVKDCSDFDFREDAEEYAYTYWYAKHLGSIVDHVVHTAYRDAITEIVCGYLPSRNP